MERLPLYYRALQKVVEKTQFFSSADLGKACGVNDVQVRKDLMIFKNIGRPSQGYDVKILLHCLEEFLGIRNENDVALVGCGNIGRALALFPGFKKLGVHFTLIFDNDPEKVGNSINGIAIQPLENFTKLVKRLGIRIGVIAVPSSEAQKIGEMMSDAGIIYICNFAPVTLTLSPEIQIRNEDITVGFVLASHYVHSAERL